MVICPDCGRDVPDAKFCKNCGSRLPEQTVIDENFSDDEIYVEATEVKDEEVNSDSNRKFCYSCGHQIAGNLKYCPNCGANLESGGSNSNVAIVDSSQQKNVVLAIILSVIFPGLGQIYLRLDKKGAYFIIGYVISAILILFLIGFLLCLVIWIWALVDTIQSVNAINNGENVEDKLF